MTTEIRPSFSKPCRASVCILCCSLSARSVTFIDFPKGRHMCSYARLIPSVHTSAGKTRLSCLMKQGSSWLR
ncbi:MAG: hypothetical protein CV089_22490 [Nitrospira sp. WS110]|nr:hypothetical protein [Nitrospira sp. WS110]